jgi:hypothetical protein
MLVCPLQYVSAANVLPGLFVCFCLLHPWSYPPLRYVQSTSHLHWPPGPLTACHMAPTTAGRPSSATLAHYLPTNEALYSSSVIILGSCPSEVPWLLVFNTHLCQS